MNNFYYLTHDDFYVDPNGMKGPVLCCNVEGICVTLFHADQGKCMHCEEAIPEFKKLPRMFPSVLFGMNNLNKYPEVFQMSKKTIVPFKYVPYIILYYNGRPFMRYEGEKTATDMAEFIQEVMNRLQNTKTFVDKKGFKIESEAPVYGGLPYNVVCDDDKGVCYFTTDDVYGKGGLRKK